MLDVKVPRDSALAKKSAELRRSLEKWARDSKILNAGERLVFYLRIEEVPTVAEDGLTSVGDLPVGVFFSKKRLIGQGVRSQVASRIASGISYVSTGSPIGPAFEATETVNGFLANYGVGQLRRIPNLGNTCIREMARVLSETGMTLRE